MTDFDAATAWHRTKAATAALCLAFAGLGLGGCETAGTLLGGGNQAVTEAVPLQPPKPAAPQMAARIALAPIIGAPEALGQQMRTQIVQASEKSKVGILADRDAGADFSMRGYLVAARDKAGIKVSYIWDITDPSGKRVNRITGEEITPAVPAAKDPWGSVTPAVTQVIADKVASSLGTWAPSQPKATPVAATTPAAPAPAVAAAGAGAGSVAASAPVGAAVASSGVTNATTASLGSPATGSGALPSVTGAPGDGNTALGKALQRELARQGSGQVGQPGSPYKVEGKVTVGALQDGKQPIQIEWKVIDAQGKPVGSVNQKNAIPPGSLDGAWGATADAAAAAAAQGIVKLFPQRAAAAGATN